MPASCLLFTTRAQAQPTTAALFDAGTLQELRLWKPFTITSTVFPVSLF